MPNIIVDGAQTWPMQDNPFKVSSMQIVGRFNSDMSYKSLTAGVERNAVITHGNINYNVRRPGLRRDEDNLEIEFRRL